MTSTERLRVAIADRYLLKGELGAGGMATVYLAEDVRHHRPVALKVLRPELAAVIGAERFLKEIETTANLQHPHILPLFDSGEVDGTVFYVMPFVEGETLRDRIARDKQLPVEDALRIAREVASALDYAHRRGVIHRDIKPENILLHDGTALVADFGIALAASKTGNTRMTETGMSLGTPHYMSPEQAMGEREITARADVYALGCVLYEMLTGEPPFNGPTAQAIVARVLTDAPRSARGTRATVPAHVDAAISTALSKLPADRFGSAAEFAVALSTPSYGSMMAPAAAPVVVAASSRTPWIVAAAATIVALAGLGYGMTRTEDAQERPVVRSTISLNDGDYVQGNFAISRDGQSFVVEANNAGVSRLMLRRMDGDRFVSIAGTDDARFPELTSDGRRVTFRTGATQQVVPIDGGTRIAIGPGFFSSAWQPDGRIIFTRSYNSGLSIMEGEGDEARLLSTPDSTSRELGHWHPQMLADGRHVIFTTYRTPVTDSDVEVLDIKSGKRAVVVKGATYGRVLPTGPLVFLRGSAIFAVNFDATVLQVVGQPVEVLSDVAVFDTEARPYFAFSQDGTLIYGRKSLWDVPSRLEWFDRTGRRSPVAGAPENAVTPALSPNGRYVAYALRNEDWDIWVLDLARQTSTRITSGGGADLGPAWGVDSEDVLWSAERPAFHLYARRADAGTPARAVVARPTDLWWPTFTPDGRVMVYNESSGDADRLYRRDHSTGADEQILSDEESKSFPVISPDGTWMAYTSLESGRNEVYLIPYPSLTGRRLQVSSEGGIEPSFVRGGRELLFRSGLRIMSVGFDPARGALGTPTELFRQPGIAPFNPARSFTASPDGQRLMLATRPPGTEPRELVVISNWFRDVSEKLAARR